MGRQVGYSRRKTKKVGGDGFVKKVKNGRLELRVGKKSVPPSARDDTPQVQGKNFVPS